MLKYCEVCNTISPKYLEEDTWNKAIQANTEESYKRYLDLYPRGAYKKVAKGRINEIQQERLQLEDEHLWETAAIANTVTAYNEYIKVSPLNTHRNDAQNRIEAIKWAEASKNNTIEAYRSYLANGYLKHEEQALQKLSILEDKLWASATKKNDMDSYEHYLQLFKPSGKYCSTAKKCIDDIHKKEIDEEFWATTKKSNTLSSYRKYIESGKSTTHIKEAQNIVREYDKREWKRATDKNNESSYSDYLRVFPDGEYTADAKQKIHNIKGRKAIWRTFKRLCRTCIIIIVFVFIIHKVRVNNQSGHSTSSNTQTNSSTWTSTQTKKTTTDSPKFKSNNLTNTQSLEDELNKKIKGMETAKRYGDPINSQTMNEAESLLNKLQSSSNYNNYKQRINALKR